MKLNLGAALKSLKGIGRRHQEENDGEVPSIVLLLRESRVTSLDNLRLACTRAFGVGFSSNITDRFYVIQKVLFTIIKAGPHVMSFMHYAKPYGEDRTAEFLSSMSSPSQRRAWTDHTAWEAVNYVKSKGNLNREYAVMARLCAELVNESCVGAWIPQGPMMIPNDGSLTEYLEQVGCSCDVLNQ